MANITNREALRENVRNIVIDNECGRYPYQMDYYLEYDPETGTADLREFENVGGNSWLKNGICVYKAKGGINACPWADYYSDFTVACEDLGVDPQEFIAAHPEFEDADIREDSWELTEALVNENYSAFWESYRAWVESEVYAEIEEAVWDVMTDIEDAIDSGESVR